MSYILDALKKSEQQRGHGNVPDVQTVHSSGLHYRDEKKAYWPYILITVITLNLIAIVYFIANKDINSENMTATVSNTANDVSSESVRPISITPIIIPKKEGKLNKKLTTSAINNAGENNKTPAEKTLKKETVISGNRPTEKSSSISPPPIPQKKQNEVIEYYDLPESIQRELPTLTVSSHVYSGNPLQRSIVINNKFLEEGDYVLDDLTLHEITADGAIFNYHGMQFHYAVVSSWQ